MEMIVQSTRTRRFQLAPMRNLIIHPPLYHPMVSNRDLIYWEIYLRISYDDLRLSRLRSLDRRLVEDSPCIFDTNLALIPLSMPNTLYYIAHIPRLDRLKKGNKNWSVSKIEHDTVKFLFKFTLFLSHFFSSPSFPSRQKARNPSSKI